MVVPHVEARGVPLPIRAAQPQVLLVLGIGPQLLQGVVPQAIAIAKLAVVVLAPALLLPLAAGLRVAAAAATLRRGRGAAGRGHDLGHIGVRGCGPEATAHIADKLAHEIAHRGRQLGRLLLQVYAKHELQGVVENGFCVLRRNVVRGGRCRVPSRRGQGLNAGRLQRRPHVRIARRQTLLLLLDRGHP